MTVWGGGGRRLAACLAVGAALAGGCGTDSGSPLRPDGPEVLYAAVEPGPHNVLSAVTRALLQDADSARVRFGVAGSPLDSATPASRSAGDTLRLPVLGLVAATSYRLLVVAYGGTDSTLGDTLVFTTGTLPVDLPSYTAAGASPSPGFVAFAAYPYGLVLDNTGRVVWYRRLDGGPTLNFQVQPTGHYTTSPVAPLPSDSTPWVLYDALGDETGRLGCAGGLVSRFHELRLEPDGSAWLLCDESRVMNLTATGGYPDARVTATVVQHLAPDGALLFEWNAFDHFLLTDLDSASRSGPLVNFTHGNALDFDAAGHLLVSFRSLNEITSIDTATGQVRWRLGGRANQFALVDGAVPFVGQHGLRAIAPGRIQFLDNRGQAGDSRALRWDLDEAMHLATPVGIYGAPPPVDAQLGGSTQLLPGNRILVAYGNGRRVQEYGAAGAVAWEIAGDPGYVFRATRIASLYLPIPLQPEP